MLNFDEVNNALEKGYKEILDEIVQPYERLDLSNITTPLIKQEEDIKKVSVMTTALNLNARWQTAKVRIYLMMKMSILIHVLKRKSFKNYKG
jgi:hypothetical protein